MLILIQISADLCLSQGRGGAWDHRRCGTFFRSQCFALSRATQAIAPSVHRPGATQPQQFLCTSTSHSCHSNLCFYGVPKRNRPRADPVQFQQVPEAVADKRFKAAVCQPSKLAKTTQTLPCSSQAPLRPRQTFPAALTSAWGRGSVFLWTFKAAVCQPSKLPKPSPAAPRRHSGRGRPFLQLQQVPGRGSVFLVDVQACRLPASKTPQTLPCSSQAATQAAAVLSCSSNKSLKPCSVLLRRFKCSHSPAFKTRQTLPCSSQRHSGRGRPFLQLQQVPEGRGSVLLWRFKAASCQPSKLA